MAYWFQLGRDGTFDSTGYSYNRGLSVEGFDCLVNIPKQRYTPKTILGRNGRFLTGGGEYENVTRNALAYLETFTASTPVQVLRWLREFNNVTFSDDPTRYRKYDIINEVQANTDFDGIGCDLTIPFDCSPFRYWRTPSTVNINSSGGLGTSVRYDATAPNAPLIRVGRQTEGGGGGWVQFGDGTENRVEFSTLAYPLYIDTELHEVYYEDLSHGNANNITTLKKFPSWEKNEEKIVSFGGNVLKLAIQMRERDI